MMKRTFSVLKAALLLYVFIWLPIAFPANVAANEYSSWQSKVGDFQVKGEVYAIAISRNHIYIGGKFSEVAGVPARNIARWDGSGWSGLGDGVDGAVHALKATPSALYAGGEFRRAGSVDVNGIARWNGLCWSSLDQGVNGNVNAIEIKEGQIFIGGSFHTAAGVRIANVSSWNGKSWQLLSSGLEGTVTSLALHRNEIYAGGSLGGFADGRRHLVARWNGSSWIGLSGGPSTGDSMVTSMAGSEQGLFVAGTFNSIGGVPSGNVALWTGSEWVGSSEGLSGEVDLVSMTPEGLLAAGDCHLSSDDSGYALPVYRNGSWSALLDSGESSTVIASGTEKFLVSGTLNDEGTSVAIHQNDDAVAAASAFPGIEGIPSVAITSPPFGSIYTNAPSLTIPIDADASDGSGITGVDFYANCTFVGTDGSAPYEVVWSNPPAGVYALLAIAVSGTGDTNHSSAIKITVKDPNGARVSIAATSPGEAIEGGSQTGEFVVTRIGGLTNAPLPVTYTMSGSAANGVDYKKLSGRVVLPPGVFSAAIPVIPLENSKLEGHQTAVATLNNTDSFLYSVTTSNTASVIIWDNDHVVNVKAMDKEVDDEFYRTSGNAQIRFKLTRTFQGASNLDPLPVNIAFSGTAENNKDYILVGEASTGIVTFLPGEVEKIVEARLSDDLDEENCENFESVILRIVPSSRYKVGLKSTATVVIIPSPCGPPGGQLPFVYVDVVPESISENGGVAKVHFHSALADATIFYNVSGTASNGVDVLVLDPKGDFMNLLPTNTITVPADTFKTLTVRAQDDLIGEGNEFLIFSIYFEGLSYFLYPTRSGSETLIIRDDEPKLSVVSKPLVPLKEEGTKSGEFIITRSDAPPTNNLTVQFVLGGTAKVDEDYSLVPEVPGTMPTTNSVVISNGLRSVKLFLNVIDDLVGEGLENAALSILFKGGESPYYLSGTNSAIINIKDKDPILNIKPTVPKAFELGAKKGEYTVARSNSSISSDLLVFFKLEGAAAVNEDYQLLQKNIPVPILGGTNSFTIPAGQASTKIQLLPVDDVVPEEIESATISLVKTNYYGVATQAATVQIVDNEASVSIKALTPAFKEQGPEPARFRVSRTSSTSTNLEVLYRITGSATYLEDYTLTNTNRPSETITNSVVIPQGKASIDILANPINDFIPEDKETVQLNLLTNGLAYRVADGSALTELVDNEKSVSIFPVIPSIVENGVIKGQLMVLRKGSLADNLTVFYKVEGQAIPGVDYERLSGKVTIPAGQNVAYINVRALKDTNDEPDEAVIVSLEPRAGIYHVLDPSCMSVIIVDDD